MHNLLTPQDVAERLGVNARRAAYLMAHGRIPSTRLGRCVVTYESVFNHWLKRQIEAAGGSTEREWLQDAS